MAAKKAKSSRGSKPDAAGQKSRRLILVGVAGLLLVVWGFVLGVLVGRGSLPTVIETGDRDQVSKAAPVREGKPNKAAQAQPQLKFYTELDKKNDQNRPPKTPPPPPVKPKPTAPKVTTTTAPPPPKPAKTDVKTAKKEVEAKAAPTAKAEKGRWSLQAAAFRDAAEARAFADRAAAKSKLKARVVRADLKAKGVWHRVRLGRFADKKSAQSAARRLKKLGMNVIIVPDKG